MSTTKELPCILEDDQLAALLRQFNPHYPSGLKNLCMARLMLNTGLRVSEVTDLRDLVGRWLEARPESTWLFPTRTGSQVHRQSIHRTIQHYAKKASIPNANEINPHTLRHTFATRLYRETKNIRLVQKALGHSELSTTMIYTHIIDDELESALQNLGRGPD